MIDFYTRHTEIVICTCNQLCWLSQLFLVVLFDRVFLLYAFLSNEIVFVLVSSLRNAAISFFFQLKPQSRKVSDHLISISMVTSKMNIMNESPGINVIPLNPLNVAID